MTFHINANLSQEAEWLGVRSLPVPVRAKVGAFAATLAALAPPDDDVIVWTLAAVGADRLPALPNWTPPSVRAGAPRDANLVWADPAAKAVNDRRFALELATSLGCALPGARVITTIDELDAIATATAPWVCKALWTSAGRDRCYGDGITFPPELRAYATKLLERGPVVFEPWMSRICDVAVCGVVGDTIDVDPPHGLLSSVRGGFHGIDLATTNLEIAEHDVLVMIAERAGLALQQAGYRGPFGVDAFVYHDGDRRRLHPLCEINARYTFGHVARALGRRLGISRVGFDHRPPSGATVLVQPTKLDTTMVWVA